MAIDPFTFVAQILNFAILVALLRAFLYRPITGAMQRRQESIAHELREAAEREERAGEAEQHWKNLHDELAHQAEDIRSEARAEAEIIRERRLEQALREVDSRRAEWEEAMAHSRNAVADQLTRALAKGLTDALRATLTELAGADLDRQVVDRFGRALDELDGDDRATLADAESADVWTARALDAEAETELRGRLRLVTPNAALRMHVDPELVAGVELRAGGRRWAWSVRRFVDSFVADALATLPGADRDAAPPPTSSVVPEPSTAPPE